LGKNMIRPAIPNDAPAIAAIHVRAWQVAYEGIFPADFLTRLSVQQRTEFWQRELSVNRSLVLVAEREGSVAGWVSGGVSRDPDAQGASEVYAVYVAPELWRHGVGRHLMSAIEERLLASAEVTLWVLDQNRRAIDFYRTIGFEFDGAKKSEQLAGVTFTEVRLRKKRPNKAPEPTTMAVTPRATEGVSK
jgi:ribosomal protein S18 acetylase RimI-like enzyme